MPLPGGLTIAGALRRGFTFRPVTGELELVLGESAYRAESHADRITAVLCQALETVGDVPASADVVRSLSVGDRQYLIAQLTAHVDDAPVWLTANCGACQQLFDISYRHSELPVKPAGAGYPRTQVHTSAGLVEVRVPTGEDQERIALLASDADAMSELVRSLVSDAGTGAALDATAFSEEDLANIKARVEDMSPEIATELRAACRSCGAENRVPVNLYYRLGSAMDELFAEIHTLAARYYWSESDILKLPRYRRQAYLRFIDLGRGMRRAADFHQVA